MMYRRIAPKKIVVWLTQHKSVMIFSVCVLWPSFVPFFDHSLFYAELQVTLKPQPY